MSKKTYKEQLEAVKQNGYALQYVSEQTRELCLEAVKQDGIALQYVNPEHLAVEEIDYSKGIENLKQEVMEYTIEELEKMLGQKIKVVGA